jgi:hypothetical protein
MKNYGTFDIRPYVMLSGYLPEPQPGWGGVAFFVNLYGKRREIDVRKNTDSIDPRSLVS